MTIYFCFCYCSPVIIFIVQDVLGTIALLAISSSWILVSGTFMGVMLSFTASAAAAPAACPIAIQEACTRNPEFAKRSLDTHLPATIMFEDPFGTKALKGTVGTVPGCRGLGLTPSFVCKSTG